MKNSIGSGFVEARSRAACGRVIDLFKTSWHGKAARTLNPGESIQSIVAVQNFHPAFQLLGFLWVYLFGGRYNLIVATDQRIAVLQTKLTSYRHPTRVAASLPRTTTLGPVSGPPASIELNGRKFYIIAGTKKYVAIADQLRPSPLAAN